MDKREKLEQELGQLNYQMIVLRQQGELNAKRQDEIRIALTELYKKEKADAG